MSDLPAWDEMSDLDKGAVVLHLRTREDEGGAYAVENYPCEYFEHPALIALDRIAACTRAVELRREVRALDLDEWWRLYELAERRT